MAINLNYSNGEIVSSPSIIIQGKSSISSKQAVVRFVNDDNRVFPPQYCEISNSGHFKCVVHVAANQANNIVIDILENCEISSSGYLQCKYKDPRIVDSTSIRINYCFLDKNKPIHLCLLVGKDSLGQYDMPKYRLRRGEEANIDTAIRKLKVAGRLMQAYTQDEMRAVGLSNRSFQFVEEAVSHQGVFGYDTKSPVPHSEVKVHVLRSPKTVAELQDPNLTQQNPKATNKGWLFSHALDVIKNTPELSEKYKSQGTPIQCAVLYVDSHYDSKKDLILTHAALGGGNTDIKLAIFGSHGLHSWPTSFASVGPSFLDATHLSKSEVANDCNQCGTSWECLNVTMGAFMHEIGHSLGSPHQVDGVMLRDYIWLNRSFMTKELECLRERTNGRSIGNDGTWPKVCHWNIMDLIRYFYHASFSLPVDRDFGKLFSTYMRRYEGDDEMNSAPSLYHLLQGSALIKSKSGIFMFELVAKGLARYHIAYFPQSYGGHGLQHELVLDYNFCYNALKGNFKEASENFDVRVLSLGGDLYIQDFKSHCVMDSIRVDKSNYGLGEGTFNCFKSSLLGKSKDKKQEVSLFNLDTVKKVRIFHGGALDGIKFYYHGPSRTTDDPPKIPPRNYIDKLAHKIKQVDISKNDSEFSSLVGHEKSKYSEFILNGGEIIEKLHIRNGAWIDAVQFETNTGRKSPMYGNSKGGHLSTLEVPSEGFTIMGMYWFVGSWLDGIGSLYTNEI